MSPLTRVLNFVTNDLGKNATLVLVIDPDDYNSVFPVIWKAAAFGASGPYLFSVTYKSEFGFTRAEITSGGIVVASAYIHVKDGEKSILTASGDPPVYSWSIPSQIQPPTNQIEAENGTHEVQNIGLGLSERPDKEPSPVLLFEGVGPAALVRLELTPVLSGYITSGYKEGDILRQPIPSPIVFKENLLQLDEVTNWRLGYDPATGHFKITREQ